MPNVVSVTRIEPFKVEGTEKAVPLDPSGAVLPSKWLLRRINVDVVQQLNTNSMVASILYSGILRQDNANHNHISIMKS